MSGAWWAALAVFTLAACWFCLWLLRVWEAWSLEAFKRILAADSRHALFPPGQRSKAFIGAMQPNEVLHWPQNRKQTEHSVFEAACGLIAPRQYDGQGRTVLTAESDLGARVLELETRLRVLEDKMKRGSG